MRTLMLSRHRRAAPILLLFVLLAAVTGVAAVAQSQAADATVAEITADDIAEGQKIFAANCATCHGMDAQGTQGVAPSLVGVGAAAVNFQVGTGRMPAQASGPQAPAKPKQFSDEQQAQLAAFVASLGPGPAIPTDEQIDASLGNPANGMALFRTNCAMCHGSVGGGGALTQGKYAPSLMETDPRHIYEAMLTGPQSMPVFNEANISPEGKRDIIAFLMAQRDGSAGGDGLGTIGPVAEGLWGWMIGLGFIVAITVWIGARSS